MKRDRAVLFDLDGTLVDSAPDLAVSVACALARVGRDAPGLAEIRSYVGEGAARLLHRALTGDHDGVAEDALLRTASEVFFEHYAAHLCVHSTLYPDVRETLEVLRERGCHFACVTNKPARYTLPLLEALGIASYFPVCVSGDTLAQKKPDPAPLLSACSALGIEPDCCTMVGDTVTDILAAHNAGMAIVAVDYGYGTRAALDECGPDRIVGSFRDIADCVPRLLAAC